MPEFQYVAKESSGRQVTGLLTANNDREALTALAAQKLFPIRVEPAASAKAQQQHVGRRVRMRHLVMFYTQLSDLLRAGVPLLRSLELLQRKAPSPALRVVLEDVRQQVADGMRLAEAMRRHARAFGELGISMVRAGEEGGFLEDVLKRVASFTEHQENLKSRVVGALVYPMFLLGMGSVIVSLMIVFFVPKFEPILANMADRGTLPWSTTALLALSDTLRQYGWLVLLGVGGGGYLLVNWLKTPAGKRRLDAIRLRAPGMGPVVRSLAIARFCRILGTLLRNGVPILQSLRISKDATGNIILSEAIGEAAESISTGRSLAAPLEASRQFPEEVVEMIAVGEEANNLEQVLIDVADNMERHTQRHLDLFVRMVEPVLLTLMAGIVLFVVVALLLPILQSSGAF